LMGSFTAVQLMEISIRSIQLLATKRSCSTQVLTNYPASQRR
jgi:hypothetical protein